MNIVKFIGVLAGKIKYLLILPIIVGAITFFMVKDAPKNYTADTTIYTGITSNSGLDVTATKVDKLITQNEYSNIMSILKSNSLFEEISLRLLAQHLSLAKPQPDIISNESFKKIQAELPAEVKKLAVKGNEEKTYENLRKYVKQDEKNFIYKLLYYTHPFYSIDALSGIKAEQVNSSDIFKLSYESSDPGVCYNTVKIAAEAFIKNYGEIKRNLKTSAVKYFQTKLDDVTSKLNTSENNLLNFNVDNSIINYYEQTKQVTTQNEEIELRLQDTKMNYESSIAVLKKIEGEISKRFSINLKNIEILNIRSQLVDCNNKIAMYTVNPELAKTSNISDLNSQKQKLERNLGICLDSIYSMESSTQGIESQKILGEWLDAVKSFETNKSMYKSMQDRQAEFMLQFKRYAPLGANIKKIEREINVYESEYLDILNSLNSALQNEQNQDIISNMKIIDEPKFPISSLPSKKKLYIIIAVLMTLIFYITGLFIIELLDNRLKTPALLKTLTGLEPAGAFCISNNKKFTAAEIITEKSSGFIIEKLRLLSKPSSETTVLQIFSIWDDVGKTFVAESVSNVLQKLGFKTLIINLSTIYNEYEKSTDKENVPDIIRKYFMARKYSELAEEEYSTIDYLICIVPAISKGIDNSTLISKGDINLIVYHADMTWTSADQFNTEKLKVLLNNNLFATLTNALPENLEEIYGDIPKKRSKFRVLTKKWLRRFTR